jgi:UDP-2,3-diacylglucosamine hydrolase
MTLPPLPRFTELAAPPSWRSVELISDLHLQLEEPATFETWRRFMAGTRADALFILGDLFEVWVGDDIALQPGFAADCASVLQAAAHRLPVFIMHGNRDFLVGDGMIRACGATLLADPTVLSFAGRRWLLTHGDELCLADTDYMQFRAQVRSPTWQREFLAKPLAQRQAIGRELRAQSEARKRAGGGVEYADVDEEFAQAWLAGADAEVMIHGHTHRPGDHRLSGNRTRIVLSDWDAVAVPPRTEVLRLSAQGADRIAFA